MPRWKPVRSLAAAFLIISVTAACDNQTQSSPLTHPSHTATLTPNEPSSVPTETRGVVTDEDVVMAPNIKPDKKTILLSRGGLPLNNLVSESWPTKTENVVMDVVCQGQGTFKVGWKQQGKTTLWSMSCANQEMQRRKGWIIRGKATWLVMGTAGIHFMVRVQPAA